jgi:hypothetical protein
LQALHPDTEDSGDDEAEEDGMYDDAEEDGGPENMDAD